MGPRGHLGEGPGEASETQEAAAPAPSRAVAMAVAVHSGAPRLGKGTESCLSAPSSGAQATFVLGGLSPLGFWSQPS